MEVLKFKGKMSLKNKILIFLAIILVITAISITIAYIVNEEVRNWINVNILKKEVTEDDVATIEIDADKQKYILAYDKYIGIIGNSKLEIYNSYGSKTSELDISISNANTSTNGQYLAIAENGGQKAYLIADEKILWENTVEGNITKINVSKSGYVSIITEGTSYKSVIITFDKNGKELFKTYLASTIAVGADISADGKFLAIAEVNINGALLSSSIKIIEMSKASNGDTTNSVVYRYSAEEGKLITNIKYQEKGQLICIYNDSIHMIYQDQETTLTEFNSNVKLADINLKSSTVRTEEESAGFLKVKTNVILNNIISNAEISYTVDSVVRELKSYNQIVAINLGTEVDLINLNGWLEKKYTSYQEIKNIVLGTSVAGIVYGDRIKIITF